MPEIEGGYIKLYRKMTKWQWYSDEVMFRVFMHLLLTVNYEPAYWRDIEIDRGQTVISVAKLSATLKYSKETVHRALKRLESSGEIIRQPNARYTIVTIVNYNLYQDKPNDSQTIAKRLPNDSQTIAKRRLVTIEEVKKNKKNKKNEEEEEGGACSALPTAPTAPDEITEEKLKALYGIEATERYKRKFYRWCEKKNKPSIDCIVTIARWMEQDNVPKRTNRESSLSSSFNANDFDKTILDEYE